MKQSTYGLLLLMTVLGFQTLGAQELVWSAEKKIFTGGHGSHIRPRILALDDDKGIILWGNEHAQSIHYALWEKDSLSAIYTPDMKQTRAFITSWASTEIAGRGQYVYFVYKEDPAETGKIYLLVSTDYGKSFTDPIPVVIPQGFYCRFPGVAIDEENHPIVTYMRFKTDWSEPEYVSIRSRNFGASFDPFSVVTDRSKGEACDCCPVSMETDRDRIAVFYRNNRNNIRNMTAAISFDNGGRFDRVHELDTADWFLQSCPSTGGDGFFNDQYLHTIWSSGRTGISKVFYSRLNMDSWKIDEFQIMNHSLGRNFQQTYPRISGRNDTVGVVWSELVNSMDVFFSWFTGYQTADLVKHTVRVNQSISGNQAAADVAYAGQNFYLCWQDLNDNSIVFKSSRIKTATDADNGLRENPFRIRMDHQHAEIESDQPIENWRFSDLKGRVLASGNLDQRISLTSPSNGIYLFHYSIGAQSRSVKLVF